MRRKMPQYISVKITKGLIKNSTPGDGEYCPIATAVYRKFKNCKVSVDGKEASLWYNGIEHVYALTEKSKRFVRNYDRPRYRFAAQPGRYSMRKVTTV